MSNLNHIMNSPTVKAYFNNELEISDEELKSRIRNYLEIFPFIVLDFIMNNPDITEEEVINVFKQKHKMYKNILLALREESEMQELVINL